MQASLRRTKNEERQSLLILSPAAYFILRLQRRL